MLNFRFDTEQKVYEIAGIKVGGQPGENPTALIGSIFHKGDRLIEDRRKRKFDREKATEYIRRQEKLSAETGVPGMIDIVANSLDEFKSWVDFVANTSRMPFCVGMWKLGVRLGAVEYCARQGLLDRMVYNSLSVFSEDLEGEAEKVKELGVKHVILMTFDMADQTPAGRLKGMEKLLKVVEDAPFESILVDTSTMNAPGLTFCAISNYLVKKEYGFPCGSAPANGTYTWKEARERWGRDAFAGINSGANAIASVLFHDFMFYGPLVAAPRIFPAVALASMIAATMAFHDGVRLPENEAHPLNRFYADFARQLKEVMK